MSAARALLATRVRVAVRDARTGARGMMSVIVIAIVSGGLVPLGGARFGAAVFRWSHAVPHPDLPVLRIVTMGVWQSCLLIGALTFAIQGFASRPARLLASLPLEHRERYRALVVQTLASRFGLVVSVFLGAALFVARMPDSLGPGNMPGLCVGALSLFVIGGLAWVSLALLASGERRGRRRALAFLASCGFLVAAAFASLWLPSGGVASAAILAGAAFAAVGPGAGAVGEVAFLALVASSASAGARRNTATPMVARVLMRLRTPTGALLFRGYLARRRNPFTYVRVGLIGVAAVAFPHVLRIASIRTSWPVWVVVAAYSLAVTHLVAQEVAVQSMAGEGARFARVLHCPVTPLALLRARAVATASPVLVVVALVTLALGAFAGLEGRELARAVAVAGVISSSAAAALALAGSLDLDLDRSVDTPAEAMLADDAPAEPVRLMLVGATALLQAGQMALAARLPAFPALGLLLLSGALLDAIAMALAYARVASLVRGAAR